MLVQNSANRRTSLFFLPLPLEDVDGAAPLSLSEDLTIWTIWTIWAKHLMTDMTCHDLPLSHPLGMARSAVGTATDQNLSAGLLHFTPVWKMLKRRCRTDSRCCAWSGQTPAACCAETSSIAIFTSAIEAWHILAHLTQRGTQLNILCQYMSRSENGSANKGMLSGG